MAERTFVLDARTATKHFPGIGRYVACLAGAMGSELERDEQLWLLVDPRQSSHWALSKSSPDHRVKRKAVPVSPFSLSQQWHIPRCLRSLAADVYHSPYYIMPYRTRTPTVVTIYDVLFARMPRAVSPLARTFSPALTRLALRCADHVVTPSEAVRRDLLASHDSADLRSSVVPLGIDPRFEPSSPAEEQRARDRLELPESFALYVGSNKPHKNLLRLVQAWQCLKDTRRQLVVAGAWDERYPEAKRWLADRGLAGSVRFLGEVEESDLPALYSAAALFVLPSLDEGFGLPVIEAMACGTPVVCSRVPSLEEVGGGATHDFDPSSTEAMAGAMKRVLDDGALRDELRERGLARAAQFSWKRTAQGTLEVYRQLASHRVASRNH